VFFSVIMKFFGPRGTAKARNTEVAKERVGEGAKGRDGEEA